MSHFTIIYSAFYLFNFQPIDPTIGSQTSSQLQIKEENQSIRSALNQTTTPDHQIRPQIRPLALRPPNQTIRSERQTTGPQTTDHHPCLLSFQSAQLTQSLEMLQVRCSILWVGTREVYRALDEPYKAYIPSTFGLQFPDFFRLNLTVVRSVRGVPRASKSLPCPFS